MSTDSLLIGVSVKPLPNQSARVGQGNLGSQRIFKDIIYSQMQKLDKYDGKAAGEDQDQTDLLSCLKAMIQGLDKLNPDSDGLGSARLSLPQDKEIRKLLSEIKQLLSDLQVAQEMGALSLSPNELTQLKRALSELISFLKGAEQEEGSIGLESHREAKNISSLLGLSSVAGSKEVDENRGAGVAENNLDPEEGEAAKVLSQLRDNLEAIGHKQLDLEKGKNNVQIESVFVGAQKNPLIDSLSKIKELLRKVKDSRELGKGVENDLMRLGVTDKNNLQIESGSGVNRIINSNGIVGKRYGLLADHKLTNETNRDRVSMIMVGERGEVSSDKQGELILQMGKSGGVLAPKAPASDVSVARVVMAVKHLLSMNKIPGGMRIRLHPPELGNLRIDVKLDKGALLVQLQAEKEGAHHLIKSHLNEIRGQLVNLGQFQDIKVEILPNHGIADSRSENYLNWHNGQKRYYQEREKDKTEKDGFSEVFSEIINTIA